MLYANDSSCMFSLSLSSVQLLIYCVITAVNYIISRSMSKDTLYACMYNGFPVIFFSNCLYASLMILLMYLKYPVIWIHSSMKPTIDVTRPTNKNICRK